MIQLLNTPSTAEYNTNAARGLVYVLSMRICSILLVIVIVMGSWSTVDGFSILRSRHKEGFLLKTNIDQSFWQKNIKFSSVPTKCYCHWTISVSPESGKKTCHLSKLNIHQLLHTEQFVLEKKSETESLRTAGPLEEFWNPSFSAVLSTAVNDKRKYQAQPWKTQRVWSSTKSPGSPSFPARSHKGDQHPINFPGFVPQNSPSLDTMEPPYPKPTSVDLASLDFKGFLLMISVGPFATLVWPVVPLSLKWLVVEALW